MEVSQMHNRCLSSRVTSFSDKSLPGFRRWERVLPNFRPIDPRRVCGAVTLRAEEEEQVAQPDKGTGKQVDSPRKRVWRVRTYGNQDPQATWEKMMTDIKEAGSAVLVVKAYHEAGKVTKEALVGTLTRLKKLKEWRFVVEIIKWLKRQDWWTFCEQDYYLLLAAYGKLGEPEKVKQTISSMQKAGIQPNVASYTALIDAYGKKGLLYEAEGILNKMLEEGPQPSALSYQTLISAYVKAEKYEDVDRIFKDIETENTIKPDEKLYNLMIHSYGKRGMTNEALRLSRKMKALDIPMSVVTYNTLLACQPSVKDTEGVFRQMQRMKIKPDVFSYASRISAFAKARRAEEAQYFFKIMVASGIRPNRTVYNILLDAYANCKMVEEAESLLKEMKRERYRPDATSYTTLLNAYVNVSDMERAEKVIQRMKQAGVEPCVITYGTLIKGYAEHGDLKTMSSKYEEMVSQKIQPSQTIFTIMLQAFGRFDSLDRAKDWFQKMVDMGLEPDDRARETLVALATPLHRKEEIFDFFDNLP